MKTSRKLGQKAFYLLFGLIIIFVVTELAKTFIPFSMSLEAWKLALSTAAILFGGVWGGVATKNFSRVPDKKGIVDDVQEGGN